MSKKSEWIIEIRDGIPHLKYEEAELFNCPMPNDGQAIWITTEAGHVFEDVCENDDGLFGLEGNGDWSDRKELIRCKDCKHWHEDVANFTSIQRGGCKLVRGLTNSEFFCALGERREANE